MHPFYKIRLTDKSVRVPWFKHPLMLLCLGVIFVVFFFVKLVAIVAKFLSVIIAHFNFSIDSHTSVLPISFIPRAFAMALFTFFVDTTTMPAWRTFASIVSNAVGAI